MMGKISIYCILLSLVLLLFNCNRDRSCDDDLSLQQSDYTGSDLKLNGYFFKYDSINDNFKEIYFLYQNGVVLSSQLDGFDASNPDNIDVEFFNQALKSKAAYGLFEVSGDIIQIERWYPSLRGCFRTIYETGRIVNDTTFKITRLEYRKNGSVKSVEQPDYIIHFRPLPEKPDSTNEYIQ